MKRAVLRAVTKRPRSVIEIVRRVAEREKDLQLGRHYVAQVLSEAFEEGAIHRKRLRAPARGGQPPFGYYRA